MKKAAAKKVPTTGTPAAKTAATTATARKSTTKAKAKANANAKARASREEIEHAAYLNYCGRKEKALSGDAHADWIEAERKLL